jgi:hypothetical protein
LPVDFAEPQSKDLHRVSGKLETNGALGFKKRRELPCMIGSQPRSIHSK